MLGILAGSPRNPSPRARVFPGWAPSPLTNISRDAVCDLPGNCRAVGSFLSKTYYQRNRSSKKPPPLTAATAARATTTSNLMRVAYSRTITSFR